MLALFNCKCIIWNSKQKLKNNKINNFSNRKPPIILIFQIHYLTHLSLFMCSYMKFNYGECLELGYCLEFDFRVLKYIVVRNYDIFI